MAWYIEEYQSILGSLPVSRWYGRLTEKNQAIADAIFFEIRDSENLRKSLFKKIKGVSELRQTSWSGESNVQHRIFCYSPLGKIIVFLCGCTKRSTREYNPPNALQTSVKRLKEIKTGKAGTHEFYH